uniref:Telomerase protein component 1 n=1 Tax=Schistosoma haematobium TaxID=6185 RepID=A0A095C9W7_SCHHA
MDHESGHLKGPSSLLSPVYLEGKNLVKNKLLDEPFTKTSSASNTLSSLSLNNKSLKSSISLSYTSSVLHCDHEVTVRPNDKHHVERRTSVPSSLKSTPIDWLNDAIIKISDTSFQNILECTVDDSMKSNSIHNTFGNLLTYERRDTYKQLKLELISCISSSIVDGSPSKEKKIVLGQSIHSCIDKDPEFILKALKRSQSGVVVNTDIDAIIYRLAHSPRIYFTIKELIRRLHISRPKFNVMCVLGKPYPSDSTDFIRMGLEGDWDSSKAGTCMKFPIPVTWETELSVNGNNSDSWSKLITLNKVPHMAMLRNLRNILMSGIQDGLHEIVLKRLTDPRIIIEGKQFPFRYFSAFDTLEKCERRLTFQQSVYRVERIAVRLFCNHNTLNRYKNALNTALELSMKHNLPPICGSTLIICSTSKYVNPSKNRSSKSYIQILGFLLGAMCTSICETPTTYVTVDDQYNLTPIEVVFREKRTLNNGDSKHNESLSKHKNMGILERTKQMYETRGRYTMQEEII